LNFADRPIIAIDGEGLTRERDGRRVHDYCLLSAWTHDREIATVEKLTPGGLTTADSLGFLLGLPQDAITVGYSLGYDLTMQLRDVENRTLYSLTHPEKRRGRFGPKPITLGRLVVRIGDRVERECLARANMVGRRLSIRFVLPGEHRSSCDGRRCEGCKVVRSVTIWDVFTFFQQSFVKAAEAWKVIGPEDAAYIAKMKDDRRHFTEADWPEVRRYCGIECQRLAAMMGYVRQAHADVGIALRTFFGAGSSATALLESVNVRQFMYPVIGKDKTTGRAILAKRVALPPSMLDAVARGFFGGRFEIAIIGTLDVPIFSDDIAAAYPYATCFLPCLVHGKWSHVSKPTLGQIERASAALVRYRLPESRAVRVDHRHTKPFYPTDTKEHATSDEPWGPLPFRTRDGCIIFPVTSGGGWAWREELLPAMRFADNVQPGEAWLYHTSCSCRVLQDVIPEMYRTRLTWGKEGAGLTAKLASNACPGKFSQSRGSAPYQNWVWAGIVMATTRGQLLDAMACAPRRDVILATATDSIFATERLTLPTPRDTGTADAAREAGKVPMGAWEPSAPMSGVHLIKPGVLFPLRGELVDATSGEAKTVKARGIGKRLLQEERAAILEQWRKKGPAPFTVTRPQFYGMRASLHIHHDRTVTRAANFGTWDDVPLEITYMTTPKRPFADDGGRLHTWALDRYMVSAAYNRSVVPPHVVALTKERDLEADQPDLPDDLGDTDAL
jgi:hypothetical protein